FRSLYENPRERKPPGREKGREGRGMRVIETFTGSAKGERTEDLIVETPHYLGVFDGVTGTRGTGEVEGRTLGQWASALAGEALRELPANAALRDFADLAT